MYRLLRAQGETGDRRRHATHPARVKPELVATKPNQCWSWDITKLAGPARWTWFYLYVILLCQRTPAPLDPMATPINSSDLTEHY
jgi:putative transposase